MRILVIGDACIDEYRYGEIRRVNPESTAPLLNFDSSEEKMGMAFNVAQNLKAFGANITLSVGEELSRKIRYIDLRTGEHLLRVDHDVQAKPYLVGSKYPFDAIVISDYNKGFVINETIWNLRQRFNGPIYMDTKTLQKRSNCFWYSFTDHTFCRLHRIPSTHKSQLQPKTKQMRNHQ